MPRRLSTSSSPTPLAYFYRQYWQFLVYVVVGTLLIVGIFLIFSLPKGFVLSPHTALLPQREFLVGELYYSPELVSNLSTESSQNLFNKDTQLTSQLRFVGMAGIIDAQHIVTAAHIITDESGYYYFYNQELAWQLLDNWEVYPQRELAFGTFKDFESQNILGYQVPIATQLGRDEELTVWTKKQAKLHVSHPVVGELEKEISLQQAWGEVKLESLPVIELKATNRLGDSGSPLFNQAGELVGVLVGVDLHDEHTSYGVRL